MNKQSLGFAIVAKVTLACNLLCKYCYCSDTSSPRMTHDTLVGMLYGAAELDAANVEVIWHGGEPLLAGLDFFQDALHIEQEVTRIGGVTFTNSIQTNATLLTSQHIAFFREHKFKVGISIDGYPELNDRNRLTKSGESSYDMVVENYWRLRSGGIMPGILAVLDLDHPPDVTRFVEWLIELDCTSISLNLRYDHRMTRYDWRYREFLRALAQEIAAKQWRVSVRELLPKVATRGIYDACHPGWPCHRTIGAVDEKGNIYFGCDRFMDTSLPHARQFVIGHVDRGFREAFTSETYLRLADQADRELDACRDQCELFELCQGGCIADRLLVTPEGRQAPRWAAAYCAGQKVKKEVIYRV